MNYKIEIPIKLPSCNEYIDACRYSRYTGAKMKAEIEEEIGTYIKPLPTIQKPITIHFEWIEGNKRRDFDNICFAKKFILDSMVKNGKLKDDNRKCVSGFIDTFFYGKKTKVILNIKEIDNMKEDESCEKELLGCNGCYYENQCEDSEKIKKEKKDE